MNGFMCKAAIDKTTRRRSPAVAAYLLGRSLGSMNSPGMQRDVPKTISAGEACKSSLKVVRKPRTTAGSTVGHRNLGTLLNAAKSTLHTLHHAIRLWVIWCGVNLISSQETRECLMKLGFELSTLVGPDFERSAKNWNPIIKEYSSNGWSYHVTHVAEFGSNVCMYLPFLARDALFGPE